MLTVYVLLIIAAALTIWLMFHRGFWVLALFIGGLAAAFATLSSIVYFQILPALGFAVLAWMLWCGCCLVAGDE